MKQTLTLPKDREHAEALIRKFNDKAADMGCEPLAYAFSSQVIRRDPLATLETVTITGTLPRLNGWEVIACVRDARGSDTPKGLTHEQIRARGGDMLEMYVSTELPEKYREVDRSCDHCEIKRFRREVYLLRHESGDWAQVGSTCLDSFTGGAKLFLRYAEMAKKLEKDLPAFNPRDAAGYEPTAWVLDVVTAAFYKHITTHGFTPKYLAEKIEHSNPTSAQLLRAFVTNELPAIGLDEVDAAQKIITKMRAMRPNNDYQDRVSEVFTKPYAAASDFAIVAAAVNGYIRNANAPKPTIGKEYLGEIGEKFEKLPVYVDNVKSYTDGFGCTRYIVSLVAGESILTWFTAVIPNVERGQMRRASFRVKAHTIYQDSKQTVVTYCKLA